MAGKIVFKSDNFTLDKPFETRILRKNVGALNYQLMSTFLKDYDNAYGAKRAPAPDLDWRDLSGINGDLKFEVLECEDASFVGEYKIDKTGGNGHQSYWFAGGEPNIATKHALFKLKKKQQDGTYAPTDYEVGCTASDGAGEGWWPEAITPATRKDHWVIRINGGASGVVSSCKFTRVVNPTNQVKFTKDNFLVKLEERILSWKMPQDGNKEFELGAVISGSVATGYKFLFSRNILNLVRQNLNGTTGNSLAITSEGAFYYAYSDKLQPDGTIYNPTDSYVGQPISNINWSKIKEIKFRVRGGQYALDLSTTNSQDGSTSIVGLKRENGVYKIKLYEINGSGASSSIGADWTTLPLNQMKEVATMISGRNAKYYMKIDSEDNHLWFALSGNSSVVNIRLIIDSFEFLYVE